GSTDPFVINEMDRMLNIDGDRNTDDFQPQMSFRILYPGKTVVEKVSEPMGMLQIGEEKELTLDMRFAGLSKGAFTQNLNILTTNPLTPMAHFQVEGNMDIEGKSELFIYPKEEIKGLSCLRTQPLKGEIQISNKGTAPMVINEITSSETHLQFEPVSQKEIAPNTTYLLSFDCVTSVVGDFSSNLNIRVDNMDHPVKVSYSVQSEPVLHISQTAFEQTQAAGTKEIVPVLFKNEGQGELNVRLEGSNLVYATGYNPENSKLSYTFMRSDETQEVLYDWVDKRSESTLIPVESFIGDKPNYFGVIMPFKFSYYGQQYDTLWVHKDGFVSFDTLPEEDNIDLPAPRYIGVNDTYNNIIAPMWGIHVPSVFTDPEKT
ncbi:MAG: hypothetical protein ACRC9Q_09860, partial [Bacteroidales bacterium]